jgi:hypothetical protein
LSIVVQLQKESADTANEYPFEIRIKNNDKLILSQPINANFMSKPKTRLLLEINGLLVTESGTVSIELLREGTSVLQSFIEIRLPVRPQVVQS